MWIKKEPTPKIDHKQVGEVYLDIGHYCYRVNAYVTLEGKFYARYNSTHYPISNKDGEGYTWIWRNSL